MNAHDTAVDIIYLKYNEIYRESQQPQGILMDKVFRFLKRQKRKVQVFNISRVNNNFDSNVNINVDNFYLFNFIFFNLIMKTN